MYHVWNDGTVNDYICLIDKQFFRKFLYGPDGTRTHALCVANATFSQLNYEPFCFLLYLFFLTNTREFLKLF